MPVAGQGQGPAEDLTFPDSDRIGNESLQGSIRRERDYSLLTSPVCLKRDCMLMDDL
jgi:hypothetical protein